MALAQSGVAQCFEEWYIAFEVLNLPFDLLCELFHDRLRFFNAPKCFLDVLLQLVNGLFGLHAADFFEVVVENGAREAPE